MREWSAEEVADGLHQVSMRFAMESRSQRGTLTSTQSKVMAIGGDGGVGKADVAVVAAAPGQGAVPVASVEEGSSSSGRSSSSGGHTQQGGDARARVLMP